MNKKISILIVFLLLNSFALGESNSIKVLVNDEKIKFDQEATIFEDQLMLPIRPIFEALGLEVLWDDESRSVNGKSENTVIKLEIGHSDAMLNGEIIKLDFPVMIINNRSMVEVSFFEEALAAELTWDKDLNLVEIKKDLKEKEYLTSLTYSNLLDEESQNQVRKAMEFSEIPEENIDFFFDELNYYNKAVEGTSLVEKGFKTIDKLQPEYDLVSMIDLWDAKNPLFIGYNCRILSYGLMKDSIDIGKIDTSNASWMVFDENALEYNPKDVFTEKEHQEFQTLFSYIPTQLTKDISVHLENVKKDWAKKEIDFTDKDKKSIISVFFHDEEGYLFIGHMGVLLLDENDKLLFVEKLSFQEPYQAIKFDNRTQLNDYLMNKYDISWNQPTARPFIMENDELLETYRKKPINEKND